jgi:hypothetical protein
MIYFCHVPKTSGISIVSEVTQAFNKLLRFPNPKSNEVYDPGSIINPNQKDFENFLQTSLTKYDFLYGHLGAGPSR